MSLTANHMAFAAVDGAMDGGDESAVKNSVLEVNSAKGLHREKGQTGALYSTSVISRSA